MIYSGTSTKGHLPKTATFSFKRTVPLHTAVSPAIWIDQSELSRREKLSCPEFNVSYQEKHRSRATFLTGSCIKYSGKGIYNSTDCIKGKLWNILSLQASNLVPSSGNSLLVRRVPPVKIIVLSFWTKYVVPHQILLRILNLTIKRAQSTICVVFICVCWAENGYFQVVLVGQLISSFDCRTYCRRSCRMQGIHSLSF